MSAITHTLVGFYRGTKTQESETRKAVQLWEIQFKKNATLPINAGRLHQY